MSVDSVRVSLALGIRLSPNSFQRVKIEDIDLDCKIEQLKLEASKATNLPMHFLELIYCGNVLDDNATLQSCGLKQGVMVHVLKKKERDPPPAVRTMTEADIQELVLAFRTFTRHPSYRSALHRLSRQEVLENIIMATPGLSEDPVADSILRDPELLVHMENADTVRRIAELHPSLAEAANHIAAAVHEEATSGTSTNQGTSSGFTYALEALSDEEEMDSSQSSDSQPRGGDSLSRQQSYSTITAAQLAAALASATGLFPASPRASSSNLAGSSGNNTGLITSEMFSQAMQQAIATVVPGSGSETPANSDGGSDTASDVEAITRRLSRQLQQMRELGLTDNAVNLQALHATGGDVQAAIDLVFSGAISSDTH